MTRIVLIRHADTPNDDRVVTYFRSKGFEPEILKPFAGDKLGDVDSSVVASVVFGGPFVVTEEEKHPFLYDENRWIEQCIDQSIPLLGICLGAQSIARVLGADVGPKPDGSAEFGYYELTPTEAGKVYFPDSIYMPQAHYHEFQIPEGAERLSYSAKFGQQAYKYGDTTFGIQFHPEVTKNSFRRWQDAAWAREVKPGAQTREEQNKLMDEHDRAIHEWFMNFLDNLFGDALEKARSNCA